MNIAVMGAGAIGSLFGGFLAKGGNDVTLIARKRHVNAIKKEGLTIEGVSGRHHVYVKAETAPSRVKAPLDLILLTVKAYDTREAVKAIAKQMRSTSILLCLQNGLDIEEIAQEIVGGDQVLRGVTTHGAIVKEPGVIMHTGTGETVIGELTQTITRRAENIGDRFSKSGLPTSVTANIVGKVWTKVLINAGINPFGTLTRMTNGELLGTPGMKELMKQTVMEGWNVAQKIGIQLNDDPVTAMLQTAKRTAKNKNSTLQDIERGNRTEIEFINGALVNVGKRCGVATPLNSLLTQLVKGLERNSLQVKSK